MYFSDINVLGYLSFDLNTLKMFESVKTVVLFVLKLIYIMPVSVQNSFDIGISECLSFVHLDQRPIGSCGPRAPKQQRTRGTQRPFGRCCCFGPR